MPPLPSLDTSRIRPAQAAACDEGNAPIHLNGYALIPSSRPPRYPPRPRPATCTPYIRPPPGAHKLPILQNAFAISRTEICTTRLENRRFLLGIRRNPRPFRCAEQPTPPCGERRPR